MTTDLGDLWRGQYLEAAERANAGRWEAGIRAAKRNMRDLTLSRYWRIKNLLLVANATDDWYEVSDLSIPFQTAGADFTRRGDAATRLTTCCIS